MKFWLMMLVLGWRLRWLAWRNPDFRKQLEKRDIVMQWRTEAGSPSRWFHFIPGRVIVSSGLHAKPSVTLNFESADYAANTLIESAKNQMAFMTGMQQGKIKINGDPGHLMWFMTLMKYIAPKKKK